MTDTRTPSGLADMLTEQAADAAVKAMARYPHNRTERLSDYSAQLLAVIELAADQLRAMGGEVVSEFKLNVDTSGVAPGVAPECVAHLLHRIADSMEEITMDAPGGQYRRQRVESGPLICEWEWSL